MEIYSSRFTITVLRSLVSSWYQVLNPQQSLRGMLTSLSECTLLAVLQRMRDIISFSARSKIFCLSLKDRGVKVLVPQGSSHSVGSRPSDRGGAGGTLKKFFYAA